MKLFTSILIFLAAFILGYAISEHTKIPNRVYEFQIGKAQLKRDQNTTELSLSFIGPDHITYISKEHPLNSIKTLPSKKLIELLEKTKTMHKEPLLKLQGGAFSFYGVLREARTENEGISFLIEPFREAPLLERENITFEKAHITLSQIQ